MALDVTEQIFIHHAAFVDNDYVGSDWFGTSVPLENEAIRVRFRLQAEYALDGAAGHALDLGLGQFSCKNPPPPCVSVHSK